MVVKLLSLRSNVDIISNVEEILHEDRVIGYRLFDPRSIKLTVPETLNESAKTASKLNVNSVPWNILSSDTVFEIPADFVVVICEPVEILTKSYLEEIDGTGVTIKE